MSRVLVISDTQSPFHHKDTLDFLEVVYEEYTLDTVVHIGDELDMHALSDYSHDPDGYSAGHELKKGMKFMHQMYEIFPEALVCTSNHTARPLRKAFKHGIPKAFLREYHEFLEAPEGWVWAERHIIDGVQYEHGEGYGGERAAMRTALANMRSTVVGHHHSNFGVDYFGNKDSLIWGMAVGCLIDNNAYAFEYGKKFKKKPVVGCGVVLNGTPMPIPMWLNKKARWTGELL